MEPKNTLVELDGNLYEDLVSDILAKREIEKPKTVPKVRYGFSSFEDPREKMSYLKSVYNADASILGSEYQRFRERKKTLAVSGKYISHDDITQFRQQLDNRIFKGEKNLQDFVDGTNDIVNKVRDRFDKNVMDDEYSGRESVKLFKDNVKNDKLVRERIRVDDEVWLKGKSIEFMKKVEDDPAGDVLLEAFKKYHSKSLQVMLRDLARKLSATRIGSGFYDRRMAIGDLLRYIGKHLKQDSRRFSEIVDPKASDENKFGFRNFYAKDPSNKAVLALIHPSIQEVRDMDLVFEEMRKVLIVKANEYLSHINPVLQHSYENMTGFNNDFNTRAMQPAPLSAAIHSQAYTSKLLNQTARLPPDETYLETYGITLKNRDVASLKPNHSVSPRTLDLVIEHLRIICHKGVQRDYSSKKLRLMSPQFFHDILRGSRFYGEGVNLDQWLAESASLGSVAGGSNGRGGGIGGNPITDIYERIGFVFKFGDTHCILAEIKSREAYSVYRRRQGYGGTQNEIIIYDSNHREYRHVHNSIFMILRRFIFLELQDKTRRAKPECYQESLAYAFRRGIVPQEVSTLIQRGPNPDAIYYFFKNLQMFVEDKNPEDQKFGLAEVGDTRLKVFELIEKLSFGGVADLHGEQF